LPDVRAWVKETLAFNYLGAEIQLTVGSLEDAITICEKSTSLRPPAWSGRLDGILYNLPFLRDTKARIYQKKGNLDKAIDEYEQLIVFDPDSKERCLIHPKYHYRLAILYEQKGWPGKAIEHYQRFLVLWKDADQGFPEIEDARKRLAGLK
jgi:tetratricopeptide (TPR) repeat protein